MDTAPQPQHTRFTRAEQATVFAIDDEEPMRNALRRLLWSSGFAVEAFASASDFLDRSALSSPGCILLDLNMPGMNGLELQQELRARGVSIPVVFLTGAGSVTSAVSAFQSGAADFIEKPFSEEDLIDRVNQAVEKDRAALQRACETTVLNQKLDLLTIREKQVLILLTEGQSNKHIARKLNLSHRTVETHRARLTDKLNVRSVADLVRIVQQCEGVLQLDPSA